MTAIYTNLLFSWQPFQGKFFEIDLQQLGKWAILHTHTQFKRSPELQAGSELSPSGSKLERPRRNSLPVAWCCHNINSVAFFDFLFSPLKTSDSCWNSKGLTLNLSRPFCLCASSFVLFFLLLLLPNPGDSPSLLPSLPAEKIAWKIQILSRRTYFVAIFVISLKIFFLHFSLAECRDPRNVVATLRSGTNAPGKSTRENGENLHQAYFD